MGKSHPIGLRQRVMARVEEGHSNRTAAAHFRASNRFVNDMVIVTRLRTVIPTISTVSL